MLNVIMLSVPFLKRYAECHYAECRYAECRYAECRGPNKFHHKKEEIFFDRLTRHVAPQHSTK